MNYLEAILNAPAGVQFFFILAAITICFSWATIIRVWRTPLK